MPSAFDPEPARRPGGARESDRGASAGPDSLIDDDDGRASAELGDAPDLPGPPPPPRRASAVAPDRAVLALAWRWFFAATAVGCGTVALALVGLVPGAPLALRLETGGLFALLALTAAMAARAAPAPGAPGAMATGAAALRGPWPMTALLGGVAVASGWAALRLGWGLQAPLLPALPLLVCVLCATAGRRAGSLLAALSAVVLLAVAALHPWAGGAGVPPAAPADPAPGLRLAALLLLLAAGLACGAAMARVLGHHARAAAERERRFRGLLGVAAQAYWELDRQYRIVAFHWHGAEGGVGATGAPGAASGPAFAATRDPALDPAPDSAFDSAFDPALDSTLDPASAAPPAPVLGRLPWELPRFGCDPQTLDELLAAMDARTPFRDVLVCWAGERGHPDRLLHVSGEPRFDGRGVFLGYWGVARDVSEQLAARQALAATEERYHELFARTPTPLVLHRHGRVLDANPAALTLLGRTELAGLLGQDLLQAYEGGESRERERRRLDELDRLPPGTALPVAEFRLRVAGRVPWVRATAVRLEGGQQDQTLSIYLDLTERLVAEEAVRRSEALLQHLVATSPDLITLTELASGRYVMVNAAFERITGWPAAEVVGRTALEVGVWPDAAEREHFIARVRAEGRVVAAPLRFLARGGCTVQMQVSAARFVMDGRDYLVINAQDLTERERARLEREAILENVSIGIAVTRERRFVLANPAFEQIFGWPPGALVGQSGGVVWADAADYADVGEQAAPVLARGALFEAERRMHRRDGRAFLARVRGRAIDPRHPAQGGTVWIVEDVTERHEFERALARARDEAEAASRAKSAFLANTSHELRTPLNGMIGMAELARDPQIDEARRRLYLDQIADSAQALAGIISDILDLSKIEAGKLCLDAAPFDLGELLHALQRAYGPLAQARQLGLEVQPGPGIHGVAVLGDALRVRQILSNYISNALKFTASGGIRITARRLGTANGAGTGAADADQAERVRLEVHDTGPGIPPEVQMRLFRPFTQADDSTTRRFGGTGLGLSICRELAQLMQGEVGVVSEPGHGSTFWAELPLPVTAQAAPAHAADDDMALAGARVLLVEDNPVNLMIAGAMLERWGVGVVTAGDGRQALQAVERAVEAGTPFDLVLMDLQMPVMGGHEATRALRRMPAAARLPVVALTAAALVGERDEALAAGMNDFLTKPVDAAKLRATLARWLAHR